MAQSLIACPLCSAASFSSTNSLCLNLINVTCKWLRCTLCEEELRGLDKFTIHLLGHLLHTSDFQRHIATENIRTPELKSSKILEPLNLVKNQVQDAIDNINSSSQVLFQFQTNHAVGDIIERPSLKIDDEVMIFFNSNDKTIKTQGTQISTQNLPEKCKEISSDVGLPKITINVDKIMDQQDKNNIGPETELAQSSPTTKYFDKPTFQSTNFVTQSEPINILRTNICMSEVKKQSEIEKPSILKKAKIGNAVPQSNDMDCSTDNYDISLENQSGNKSFYLSPRSERVMGYRCDICSLVFPEESIMLMHRQLIHVEVSQDPSKTKNYKCHLCSKSFVMKGSLMVHMRVAHFGGAVVARLVEAKQLETNAVSPESAQFICSVCNKGFRKEQQLIQHEKLHDGKQCDICFKTFTTKYFLRKHKRLHTGEMPYSCNKCNKSFTFQQSYHKHLLYHNDDKPYTCTDCGRAFKELSTLHNHQRIHTGEKPFSCETCGKCFRQRVSYLVHRRIHTGVMPYRCQECGKTFRYKVSERTHKCIVPTPGSSSEKAEQTSTDAVNNELTSSTLSKESHELPRIFGCTDNDCQKEWNKNHPLEGRNQTSTTSDEQINSTFPVPADFFSLVMSPSERLQHLSLSTEPSDGSSPPQGCGPDNIDTEALKELLYDVADYT